MSLRLRLLGPAVMALVMAASAPALAEQHRQRAETAEVQPLRADPSDPDQLSDVAPVSPGEHLEVSGDSVFVGGSDGGAPDGGAVDAGADGGTGRADAATGTDASDRPPPALDDGSGCAVGGGAEGAGLCAFLLACGLLFRRRD